jgi:hypothetical protein
MTVPNMPLPDQDTGVVDGLGMSQLENEGLQPALEEVRWLEGQHVIQTLLVGLQEAVADHAAEERVALEDAPRVAFFEGQQRARSVTDLGQLHLHAPELALVSQAILANQLELRVKTLLLVRAPRLLEGLAVCKAPHTR